MKKCAPSKTSNTLGPTCVVMTEVLKRDNDKGIVCLQHFQPKPKPKFVPVISYRGQRIRDRTFIFSFCPWCGGNILPHALRSKRTPTDLDK